MKWHGMKLRSSTQFHALVGVFEFETYFNNHASFWRGGSNHNIMVSSTKISQIRNYNTLPCCLVETN